MREPAPLLDRGNHPPNAGGFACGEAASSCTEIGWDDPPVVSDTALAAVQRFLFVAAVFCVCVVVLLLVKVFQ
jgi:hypothetical protein